MSKVIFSYNGQETTILCLKEDKMKNICNKFASKIEVNLNSLYFIYNGNTINLELKYEETVNSIDKNRNIMNILVYKEEEDGLRCPKCGEIFSIDNKIIDKIIKNNYNENDILDDLKSQIENIININEINKIKSRIKSN